MMNYSGRKNIEYNYRQHYHVYRLHYHGVRWTAKNKETSTGMANHSDFLNGSTVFLGSIPGMIANIVGVIRNLLGYHGKLNRFAQILICAAAVVSTLLFNNIGWFGLLPIAAAVLYTLFMNTPDVRKLKFLILVTLILWMIHDFYVKSYVSCVFNAFSIVTCMIGIFRKENSDGNSTHQEN